MHPLASLSMRDKFSTGENGDYTILHVHKTYTCLSIFERSGDRIVLEEISLPLKKQEIKLGKTPFETARKDAFSWTLLEIDLNTLQLIECYDVLSKKFLSTESIDPFILKILRLDFNKMSLSERRKVGVKSESESLDHRPLWNPSFAFGGKEMKGRLCDAYKSNWPDDKTLLSSKQIEVYFDKELSKLPFPVWMQIVDDSFSFKIQTLDVGHHFNSPVKSRPKQSPYFEGSVKIENEKLYTKLFSTYPLKAHQFFLCNIATFEIIPLPVDHFERLNQCSYSLSFTLSPKLSEKTYELYTTVVGNKDAVIELKDLIKVPKANN